MKTQQASLIMLALKGAPIACLMVMWLARKSQRNFSRDELCNLIGLSDKTVQAGLARLQTSGLAIRLNYESWQLSPAGLKLDLVTILAHESESPVSDYELSQNGKSPLSGSSSYIKDSHDMHDKESLKQQLPKAENLRFEPDFEFLLGWLTDLLVSKTGASPTNARESLLIALDAGQDADLVIYNILAWGEYCKSKAGQGTKPATLIPARLRGLTAPPEFVDLSLSTENEITRLRETLDKELEKYVQKVEN